ncbi:S-layer homology domain-containing protein [Paenibacillus thermotolerans]|uniref:S-layer homology domain-containing protein n=1 Tax=Paenibacillus thermotolerans TaxID=3027807 RepID=UPI00236809F4|nr:MULTISPECIES: S-layer homology domain-containing protein [unclassified Paenibacillus]
MKTPHKHLKVLTSAALGISLLSGGIAPNAMAAETPAVTAGAAADELKVTFPDVPANHWARSHVAKLAASKIVKGYDDGTFGPNKNVTQQEAVVMAVRMMGLEDEALADDRTVVLGFDVDPFFRPYVVKALEERMLNLGEETQAAASGDSSLGWGRRPASREWLARLVIRAIGKDGEAASAGTPAFADASKISAGSAGFVRLAVDLGIVTGFKEDNTFRPGEPVTRAQIATFLSRADQYIPEQPGVASGYVTAASGGTIQLRTYDNQVKTFAVSPSALFFNASGAPVTAADLKTYQKVKLIEQNNTAYYVEIVSDPVQLETFEGKVSDVSIANMSITISGANGSSQYKLASNVAVVNEGGAGVNLGDITKESTLRLQRLPGTTDISNITVLKLAFNKTDEGVIQSIDTANRTVSIKPTSGSAVETYPISAGAALQLKGQPLADLAGLNVGDTVAYEVLDSTAVSLNVVKQKFVTLNVEVRGVDPEFITYVDANNTLGVKALSKTVTVNINGLDRAVLSDLQKGDRVQLTINGDTDSVEKISVFGREVSDLKQATIIIFDAAKKYILVEQETEGVQKYNISDRTEFLLDGSPMASNQYATYLQAGRKVNLTVSDQNLVRLNVVTKAEGKVTAINTTTRTISMETKTGEKLTLTYFGIPSIDIPKKTGETINDIGVGTQVFVTMDNSLTYVLHIQVKKSYVYTLTSIDATTRKLNVVDGENVASAIPLTTTTPILNAEGKTTTLAALKVGEPVVVTYMGESIQSVSLPSAFRGTITAFDVFSGKLTVKDYNNTSRDYNVADGVNVELNDKISTSLSAMKVGDRVQVVVDGTGIPYVWVASGSVRVFNSYDAAKNQITFKVANLSEQKTYNVDPYVYLHSTDGSVVALSRLKENDKVTIYVIDGKIVELLK